MPESPSRPVKPTTPFRCSTPAPSRRRDLAVPAAPAPPAGLDRRRFFAVFSALGLGASALPELLWAEAAVGAEISKETLAAAEKVAGLEFTDAEREQMLEGVRESRTAYEALRTVPLGNEVAPALVFDPLPPGREVPSGATGFALSPGTAPRRPRNPDDLGFYSVVELGRLLRAGELSSVELTGLYLERLKRWDPVLECVINLTEERALEEAERADAELAAGRDRGPLHGIPWGAKDLLAARGYRTTWGAMPYQGQELPRDAEVVRRLGEAGAVLVAKLSLGALAWGDVWFGGKTRNPWNPEEGSSGSSAGSAAATAAGLVGFAIGSETWGSIVSPSTRCGVTGLRPTFGRVSRAGAMALSWSMDKLGPLCRTVEDCAVVFHAIHGADGVDRAAVDRPFEWNPELDVRKLRVGYPASLFEREPDEEEKESHAADLETLATLEGLGIELVPFELPDLPVEALAFILSAEAAAAFDDLTRSGRDDLLVRQIARAWPNAFREARMIPAVEYIQANRVRSLLMERMAATLEGFDAYVAPSFGGNNLLITNLTGHPAVVLPNGFKESGSPTSITFLGPLYEEGKVLALARAYQEATIFHQLHPDLEAAEEKKRELEAAERDKAASRSRRGLPGSRGPSFHGPSRRGPAGPDVEVLRAGYRRSRRRAAHRLA